MSKELPLVTESSFLVESSRLILRKVGQLRRSEQLTQDEQRDRRQLELQVEQAFYRAGKALAKIAAATTVSLNTQNV